MDDVIKDTGSLVDTIHGGLSAMARYKCRKCGRFTAVARECPCGALKEDQIDVGHVPEDER